MGELKDSLACLSILGIVVEIQIPRVEEKNFLIFLQGTFFCVSYRVFVIAHLMRFLFFNSA
jgi:hypothetical protein